MDVAVGAMQVGGEAPADFVHSRVAVGRGGTADRNAPLSDPQRRLDALDDALALDRREAEAVLNHFEYVAVAALNARVALALQQLRDLGFGKAGRHRDREAENQPRVAGGVRSLGENLVDRLRRVAPHRLAATAAEQPRGAREQQLDVVVQLGHRADRRARGAHRVGLIDGDRGRNTVDAIDLRAVLTV